MAKKFKAAWKPRAQVTSVPVKPGAFADHSTAHLSGEEAVEQMVASRPSVVREIEPEHMTYAEQVQRRARTQAAVDRISAAMRELKSVAYLPNSIPLDPDALRGSTKALRDELDQLDALLSA